MSKRLAILAVLVIATASLACSSKDSGKAGAGGGSASNSSGGTSGDGTAGNGTAGDGTAGDGTAGDGTAGDGTAGDGTAGDGTGGASQGGATGAGGTLSDLCNGTCSCSNGLDDDEDGLVDGFDPECTSPFDDNEGSFATGIPGDNRDPTWQDCFFDGNSGAGDDGCRYHTDCLTGKLPLTSTKCTLSEACIDFCQPLTPNGCDCFGCCSIQRSDKTSVDVLTGDTCSVASVDDSTACPRCTKSAACNNTCGRCELCAGKTVEDLPEDCAGTTTCDDGLQTCSATESCAADAYCSQGCCTVSIR